MGQDHPSGREAGEEDGKGAVWTAGSDMPLGYTLELGRMDGAGTGFGNGWQWCDRHSQEFGGRRGRPSARLRARALKDMGRRGSWRNQAPGASTRLSFQSSHEGVLM